MNRVRILALAAGLSFPLALAACGDATAPSPLTVTLTVTELIGPIRETSDAGEPVVTCRFTLRAEATGRGSATWLGATLRIYLFGSDRSTPTDQTTLTADEVKGVWGGGEIAAGGSQLSGWIASVPLPFTGTMEFRYRASTGGAERSAQASFSCEPQTNAPPSATPPEVTALSVTPSTGELTAGSTLSVTYEASAQAGLWETAVTISGPCEVRQPFADNLPATVARTVAVRLPPECRLGQPITVGAQAIDGIGRRASRSLATGVTLFDREPPAISPIFVTPTGAPSPTFSGDYFGGDSLLVVFNAVDNHRISHLVWEILPFGVRDSLVTSQHRVLGQVKVPLLRSWFGPIQLRLYARDAVGLVSPTVTTEPGTAYVYPTIERPTISADLAGETRAIAIDTRRGRIYLAQGNDRRIAIYSPAANAITATVPLPGVPTDLDLTASGDSLVVALLGRPELAVIDLRPQTAALSTLPLPGLDASVGQAPVGVRVGANGRAYVTLGGTTASARRMIEVNVVDGTTRPLGAAGGGAGTGVGFLERSHDRSIIVLSSDQPWCTQRYDVGADTFSACVQPYAPGWPASVDATGAWFSVGFDVYDANLELVPKAVPLQGGMFAALSLDGQSLYMAAANYGVVRRATDLRLLDRTLNPIHPNLVRLSADGTMLVTVERTFASTTRISVFDMR